MAADDSALVRLKVKPILMPPGAPFEGVWIDKVPLDILVRFAAQEGVRQQHPDLWLSVALGALRFLAENLSEAEESTRQ